jgi:hypothetical protein
MVRREAAAFAADVRDDAEGATVVTAVLDFQDGASVIPFSALDGGGEEFGVSEEVASEDVSVMRRLVNMRNLAEIGHSVPSRMLGINPCPCKGMERNL